MSIFNFISTARYWDQISQLRHVLHLPITFVMSFNFILTLFHSDQISHFHSTWQANFRSHTVVHNIWDIHFSLHSSRHPCCKYSVTSYLFSVITHFPSVIIKFPFWHSRPLHVWYSCSVPVVHHISDVNESVAPCRSPLLSNFRFYIPSVTSMMSIFSWILTLLC